MSVIRILDWEMSQAQSVCVCPVSESSGKAQSVFGTWKIGKDGEWGHSFKEFFHFFLLIGKAVLEPMAEGLWFF